MAGSIREKILPKVRIRRRRQKKTYNGFDAEFYFPTR
jgi:hypothetical protein